MKTAAVDVAVVTKIAAIMIVIMTVAIITIVAIMMKIVAITTAAIMIAIIVAITTVITMTVIIVIMTTTIVIITIVIIVDVVAAERDVLSDVDHESETVVVDAELIPSHAETFTLPTEHQSFTKTHQLLLEPEVTDAVAEMVML